MKLQIAELEMAIKSDLADKNAILDKIKVERGKVMCAPISMCVQVPMDLRGTYRGVSE